MKQFFIFLFLLISSAALAQELRPTETEVLLYVLTTDLSGKPIKMDFITIKSTTNEKVFNFKSPESKFSLLVPKNDTYMIMYKGSGGEEDTVELKLPDLGYLTFSYTLKYEPAKRTMKRTFILKILFETAKSTLFPESYTYLDQFYDTLKTNPDMVVEIGGHTDNVGDDHSNQKLSEARANVARTYLIEKGIAPNRISAVGYGETKPIASNDIEAGRQKNRRTEVKILSE